MKILFIADHHIKLGQKNVPKEWARNRFNMLWDEIDRICGETGAHTIIHGGDIFDRVPTPEEVGIFDSESMELTLGILWLFRRSPSCSELISKTDVGSELSNLTE